MLCCTNKMVSVIAIIDNVAKIKNNPIVKYPTTSASLGSRSTVSEKITPAMNKRRAAA